METKTLKIIKNVSLILAGLLLGTSIVLQILTIRGNESFGTTPSLFTLSALVFVFINAGLRIKLKKRSTT
ncbi:hypothetical protein ABC345_03055 [Shouchella sp. 1P09AA]|uniref:hypothetical protein n=1 Tax=unclassified Shouchella TaxID=2893065 RepID=UPI0039A1B3FA